MVATPEAIYYEISLKALKSSIKIDSLISEHLLRELEYTVRGRLTTDSHPEHGVWLIAHCPGYEITDGSYKPYLDRKAGIRNPRLPAS